MVRYRMMQELVAEVEALEVTAPRRSARKRIFLEPPPTPPAKRKCKPTFLNEDKLKNFYMNKASARFARQALETIYEDPQSSKNGTTVLVGTPKIKRSINMEPGVATKQKKLCRKKKIKRLGMKGAKFKKLSDEEFKTRLTMIDNYLTGDVASGDSSANNGTNDPTIVVPDCLMRELQEDIETKL